MSGVINKVKEAVTGHHGSEDTTSHGTANNGPHNSKLANKLDPRVDNDRDYTSPGAAGSETTTTAHPVTSGTKATNAGPHDSNMMNKTDPRVDSDRDNRARHAEMGGAHGPHKSDMMNKADPRVDSDRDNRAAGGLYSGTTPKAPGAGGLPGKSSTSDPVEEERHVEPAGFTPHTDETTTRTFSMSQNESTGSTNHGPHKSNMMNKMDPRVDSDRDGRARHETVGSGLNSSTAGTAGTGYGHTGSVGSTGTTGSTHSIYSSGAGAGSTNHGTHNSNIMNKADPRFDSDRDNRARHETMGSGGLASGGLSSGLSGTGMSTAGSGYGTGTTGTTGTTGSSFTPGTTSTGTHGMGTTGMGTGSTNHGTHNSNVMNKMDPRFDSDLDNRARHEALGQTGYNTTGNTYNSTTPAGSSYNTPGMSSTKTTAGPHDSNLMNKMDPRVDSDLDNRQNVGSHSVGGTGAQRGYGL